jgi:hypothetical protein
LGYWITMVLALECSLLVVLPTGSQLID